MARIGRQTRLTPEVADAIVTAVRSGAPLQVSAQAVGINPRTFWEWMARGEGKDPRGRGSTELYAQFAQKVRRAESEQHLLLVGVIRTAAVTKGNWEAARAYLKMRFTDIYAERSEISGPGGSPIALDIAGTLEGLDDDALASLLDRLRTAETAGD